MLPEDPLLVEQLRAGDEDAFAALVRSWSPAMLRVARTHVAGHASAEDVVQEAWLAVIRGLPQFEGRAQLRTWAFAILLNVARRRGRLDARTTAELGGPTVDPARFQDDGELYPGHWRSGAAPEQAQPEQVLLAGEFQALLATALRELPERQRAVVELRDVHGFAAEEVCALLELTPANQRVLLHRGRARLRAALEQVEEGISA